MRGEGGKGRGGGEGGGKAVFLLITRCSLGNRVTCRKDSNRGSRTHLGGLTTAFAVFLARGRKRDEAAGGPVIARPGDLGSSRVSNASTAMAMPGGPTHLSCFKHTRAHASFQRLLSACVES